MANKINVLECGPRDGWQNLKQMLTFEQKLDLIDRLFDAGVTQMEVTSFVSPKAIPQMADAADLAKACIEKYPNAVLYALAPNFRGVENAFNAGIRNISYVISVSESHNKANIRRTHEESLEELQKIMDTYPQMNICVALATSFGCPFEGIPPIQKVVDFTKRVYDMGIRSICLADTIGIADPRQVRDTIHAVTEVMPDCEFQIHIHDTRGMGQANTLAAIECGIKTVQSTLGGLGGCPFAPGASGKQPELIGNRYASAFPYDSFQASDGRFVIGCGNDKLFTLLCTKALDRPELLEDPRFDTNIHRCENYAALKPEIEKWSSQHTIADCVAIIDAAGVPVAPINMLADVVNDDHIANAREMFVHLQHPVIGDMIVPGNPVKLMDTKPEITKCAPDLGQDNKEIYEGVLGLSDADLAKLKEEKVI